MITKTLACQLAVAFALSCACAQTAMQPEPEWRAVVRVLDEANRPVSGADVEMSFYVKPSPGKTHASERIHGLTDTNGLVHLVHQNTGSIGLGFRATKRGYYPATKGHQFADYRQDDPAKWNPAIALLLKRVVNPIPMYAKRLNAHVPVLDKPVGFDLTAGDWAAPHGNGVRSDINFTGHFDKHPDGGSDFTLTVSFPNPGDGIQEFAVSDAEKESALRSPHEAPETGYQARWVQTDKRNPGSPVETNRDPNRNYLFRVRTVLDEKGNVKSANYGKIYGDFMQFQYFLNPTPNDRNVEFDPKRNLLKGLESFENVSGP
jgi:hypothetical protein